MPWWLQLLMVIVLAVVSFCAIRKHDKNDNIVIWALITSCVTLLVNVIFLLWSRIDLFELDSLLGYKDAQLMVLSLIPTVAIAYFQYKIQLLSDQESKDRQKALELKNKEELEMSAEWHKQELRSDRIRSFSPFSLNGYAVNFNLSSCLAKYSQLKNGGKENCIFYIELKSNRLNLETFFPECYDVEFTGTAVNAQMLNSDGLIGNIDNDGIRLWLDRDCMDNNDIVQFIMYPDAFKCDGLRFETYVNLVDRSISMDNGGLSMKLRIKFDIISKSTYDEFGSFEVKSAHTNIELINSED